MSSSRKVRPVDAAAAAPSRPASAATPHPRLGDRAGALVLEVEIFDVQRQHLASPRRSLVQQPPQRLLAHRDVVATPQPLELGVRDRPGPVGGLAPARQGLGERLGHPAAAHTERRERAHRGHMAFHVAGAQPPHASTTARSSSRPVIHSNGRSGPSSCPSPTERLSVGATARGRELGLGEKPSAGSRRVGGRSRAGRKPRCGRLGAHCVAFTPPASAIPPAAAGHRFADVAGNGPFPARPYEPARTSNRRLPRQADGIEYDSRSHSSPRPSIDETGAHNTLWAPRMPPRSGRPLSAPVTRPALSSALLGGSDEGAAAGEVVAGEVGDAFGERGRGEEVSERVGAGVIEPAFREPELDGVVFEGEEA